MERYFSTISFLNKKSPMIKAFSNFLFSTIYNRDFIVCALKFIWEKTLGDKVVNLSQISILIVTSE